MGVLQFDGIDDRLNWTTVTSDLANVSDGAWTMAALLKRNATPAVTKGIMYLVSGAGGTATEAGLSFGRGVGNNAPFLDLTGGGSNAFPSLLSSTTDTYLLVVSKGSGTVAPRLGWKQEPGGAWTHEDADTTVADQIASTGVHIGMWLGGEFIEAHIGLVGIWEGAMSDAHKEALDNNWRTSDWWNSAHGTPKFLVELNVATASLVDLAENASVPSHVGTTLDAAETLDDWNFDGIGEVLQPATLIFPNRRGR